MELLIDYLRLLTASQLIFFIVAAFRSDNAKPIKATLLPLSIGLLAYMLLPLVFADLSPPLQAISWLLPEFIPLLLALLVWQVFEDEEPIPLWLYCLAFLQVAVSLWAWLEQVTGDTLYALDVARQLIKVILVLMVMVILLRGRDADLVITRLAIRQYLCVAIAVASLAVVSVELYYAFAVPHLVELVGMSLFFVNALVVNLALLWSNPTMRLLPPAAQVLTSPASLLSLQPESELHTIVSYMQEHRAYANHKFKIAQLAQELRMPEHQLRKKINQELGFRNFNQFVNSFRLEEAAARLHSQPKTPILSIALDVGFASISVFNTSFQKQYGKTPTDYRRGE